MFARQPIASISFFLLLTLFSVLTRDIAGAQERWPPWQSYGEAENTNRKKDLRRQGRLQTDASLDRQITQLKAAGKYAEAVPFAQRALALAEKKGANSLAVAKALDTLAGLYEAQNKYAEAEPLLKRSLAIREKAPGQPGVATSRERLAVAYDKTGRAADAQALRGQRTVLDEKSGGGRAAKNGDGRADNEAAAQKRAEEAKAEADRRAAEQRAKEQSAQAEQERAQAQEKKEEPATAPGRQFHARRMARPSEPLGSGAPSSEAPPAQNEAVDRTAKEDQPGSPAPEAGEQEMTPQAAPPAKVTQAPKPAAEPPLPGAFGGAPPPMDAAPSSADGEPSDDAAEAPTPPPPVAEAPSAPGASEPPPPVASAPPAAGPSLDGGAGFGRGRNMATPPQPPPMASQPPGTTPIVQPTEPSATEAGGGAATAAEPDWHVVPVYWGTDRAVQPNAKRLAYGSDRARKLQLGEAMVTVPNVHKVPNIERPWVVKVPYFDVTLYEQKEDPKSHFTLKEIKALTREQLLAQVKARLKDSKLFKDQAVVFVHGYNTSFDNGLYRTAQIAYDLDFDGATFLYSWPSGGAVASYTYDRESAQASEPYLREFLEMVVQQTGAKQVSVIAHSMGNQPLMDVLRDMRSSAPAGVEISQVILAAPDVDADSFSNLAKTIQGLAKNVTLYVASNDRALIVSRNFWGSYRAGDVPPAGPLILPGIDTIDVTAASTDTFAINHSGYASNNKLLDDIGELLKTGLRPPELRPLKPGKVSGPGGDYWRYTPPPLAPPATTATPQ